ncbi:MAG TPA: dodecin [Candidatus Binatia bacterium]|jgi:hypothetical protein
MSEQVYQQVELTGSSTTGATDAFRNAITRASKNIPNLHWLRVIETRENIEPGMENSWQVRIKVGFRTDDPTALEIGE